MIGEQNRIRKMILEDPSRPLHTWNSPGNELLDELKTIGIERKIGPWSSSEREQLKENMYYYETANPKIDLYKLIYERGSRVNRKVLKETYFWEVMSYKLCRTLYNIVSHITCMFQAKAGYKTGRFSKKENVYLRSLIKKHGRNWSLISNLMNRTVNSLNKVYNQIIKNNINQGHWNKDEIDRFKHIIGNLMQYNRLNNLPLFKISWRIVSDYVKTRSFTSCQDFMKLSKRLSEKLYSSTHCASLLKETMILYLHYSKIQSKIDFDWNELLLLFHGKYSKNELQLQYNNIESVLPSSDIKDIIRSEHYELIHQSESLFKRINFKNVLQTMSKPRTVAWLKAKLHILVNENIENFKEKSLEEIITILHGKYCTTKLVDKDNKSNEQQSTLKEKINLSIDLTFPDDDDFHDLTHVSDHSDICVADVSEGEEVIIID